MSPEAAKPSPSELERLAVEADDEGMKLGEEPKQRAFLNVMRMVKRLGLDGAVLVGKNAPPIVRRIHAANNRMFRPIDMQEGGVHLGFFMFRDLFARFSVPLIFGSPHVDFVKLLDLSDDQKRWLASDKISFVRFEDQALDLMDFGYGWMEFGHSRAVSEDAKDLIYRSHTYLEAAAATATSAYDFRGTVQSALIGAELAIKSGLACHGVDQVQLRKIYGHDIGKAARALGDLESDFDAGRVIRAISKFPDFARSRYTGAQPSRAETGRILMDAQYIASEVTRTFTERNLRKEQGTVRARAYPS
ncbi:hypothetical protein [Sphingomonas sp.]|uniref:hypothetical protein n=1 Tax=Sphingomonas sp. TaxID=28214 RepID=UPI002CC03FDB|nr:hypothetical protein [Sphingomonas sp.]HTG38608.1 hypothetical protein [Sphingomonas sp.]